MGRGRGTVPRGMGAVVEAVVGVSGGCELAGVLCDAILVVAEGSVCNDQTEQGRERERRGLGWVVERDGGRGLRKRLGLRSRSKSKSRNWRGSEVGRAGVILSRVELVVRDYNRSRSLGIPWFELTAPTTRVWFELPLLCSHCPAETNLSARSTVMIRFLGQFVLHITSHCSLPNRVRLCLNDQREIRRVIFDSTVVELQPLLLPTSHQQVIRGYLHG